LRGDYLLAVKDNQPTLTRCPGVIDKKNAENFDDEASEEDDEEA
jgi:hypothetical protein